MKHKSYVAQRKNDALYRLSLKGDKMNDAEHEQARRIIEERKAAIRATDRMLVQGVLVKREEEQEDVF